MFGSKLKAARMEKEIKQSDLAEYLGVKNTTISNWEKGVSNPDIEYVSSICKILDVAPSYFFENKEKETFSFQEQNHIKKYRTLDEFGKKAVDSTLELEYNRVHSTNEEYHFTDFDSAFNYLTSIPTFAMGGYDIDSMDKEELIEFANDMYEMDQRALKLFK